MIVTYLDSSVLVRLITGEGPVELIQTALASGPISSTLAQLEVRAAIFKLWRDGNVSTPERDVLLAESAEAIFPLLTLVALDHEVLAGAQDVVASYPLRSLDSIHVATAVRAARLAKRQGSSLDFCTADQRQARAAEAIFGLDHLTVVPASH